MLDSYKPDTIDSKILSILATNCRTPYRKMGEKLGLTTNTVKSRIQKLMSSGIIQNFSAKLNPSVLGFKTTWFIALHDSNSASETINRLNLVGHTFLRVDCLGGSSMIGVAVRDQDELKMESISEALKPAILQQMFVESSAPRHKLINTDLRIIESLMKNPRKRISDIAKEARMSQKTVARRLDMMTEKRVLQFSILCDPNAMKGYIYCGLLLGIESSSRNKILKFIQSELDDYFVFPFSLFSQYLGYSRPAAESVYGWWFGRSWSCTIFTSIFLRRRS